METIKRSFVQRALTDQRGQMLPWVALGMVVVIGMGGLTIDVSRAYVVKTQLQNAANAAALNAAPQVYLGDSTITAPSSAVISAANLFSASVGGKNYDPNMGGTVVTTVTTPCLNGLQVGKATCTSTHNVSNAVKVNETATINTYFMNLFNKSTLTVSANATAEIQGVNPWNIAIVLDATPSMQQTDPNCTGYTAEQCALSGIATMLTKLKPCAAGLTSCDVSNNTARVRVSMFTFPNVPTTGTGSVAADYNCSGTPSVLPYSLPPIPPLTKPSGGWPGYIPVEYTGANATNGDPNAGKYPATITATYQVTPANTGAADANGFLSDFYDSTQTNGLNASSILVKAVGNPNVTNPCLVPPTTLQDASGFSGGGVTYVAGAIYAATAALEAEKPIADSILNVSTNNALIVVSDGQMNTNKGMFPTGDGYTGVTNGLLTMNATGTYPSWIDACQQGMAAAENATKAGITVFGVAYGAETSGCTSTTSGVDSTVVANSGFNYPVTALSQVVPCVTMENIASSMTNFFAEQTSVGCSTSTSNAPMNSLPAIFNAITSQLGPGARLVPNDLQ